MLSQTLNITIKEIPTSMAINLPSGVGYGVCDNSLISSSRSDKPGGAFFYGSYHLFYLPEANSILKNNNNVETGTTLRPEVERGVKYSNVNPGNGEPSILAFDNLFNKHLNRTHLRGRMELCFA